MKIEEIREALEKHDEIVKISWDSNDNEAIRHGPTIVHHVCYFKVDDDAIQIVGFSIADFDNEAFIMIRKPSDLEVYRCFSESLGRGVIETPDTLRNKLKVEMGGMPRMPNFPPGVVQG